MGSSLSRTVEIQITNRTQSITLRNPRTYFECGSCSRPPVPELLPGSPDVSQFRGSSPFWGVAGILVYEAKSFTLAVYFSNPIDYNKFSMELGLELSPGKAHLGNLPSTYARMASGTYSSSFMNAKFARVTVDKSQEIVQVSNGPIRVTATMSNKRNSILKVVLEEQRGTEGRGQDASPQAVQGFPGEMGRCGTLGGTFMTSLEIQGQPENPADIPGIPQMPLEPHRQF